jgi:hypothetical protein
MDVEISDPLDRFGIFVDVGKPSDSDYAQLQLYSQVTKKEQGANDHLGVSFLPTHLVMKLCFAASDIPNYKLVLFPTKYDAEEYLSLIKDFMNFEDPSYSNYFANAYCAQV